MSGDHLENCYRATEARPLRMSRQSVPNRGVQICFLRFLQRFEKPGDAVANGSFAHGWFLLPVFYHHSGEWHAGGLEVVLNVAAPSGIRNCSLHTKMGYRRRKKRQPKGKNPRLLSTETVRSELAAFRAKLVDLSRLPQLIESQHAGFQRTRQDLDQRIWEMEKQISEIEKAPAFREAAPLLGIFGLTRVNSEGMNRIAALRNQIKSLRQARPSEHYLIDGYTCYELPFAKRALEQKLAFVKRQIAAYERVLSTREREEERAKLTKRKIENLRVVVAAVDGTTRQVATKKKRKITHNGQCPYCGLALTAGTHLDHIYPVSKGGRSTERNLVHICSTCNSRKTNLTLAQFCIKFSLDRSLIERRLTELNKDF